MCITCNVNMIIWPNSLIEWHGSQYDRRSKKFGESLSKDSAEKEDNTVLVQMLECRSIHQSCQDTVRMHPSNRGFYAYGCMNGCIYGCMWERVWTYGRLDKSVHSDLGSKPGKDISMGFRKTVGRIALAGANMCAFLRRRMSMRMCMYVHVHMHAHGTESCICV